MDNIDSGNIQKSMYRTFVFPNGSRDPLEHSALIAEENRCLADKRTLPTFGQAIVHYIATGMALKENKNRGLMVWHSTGSGKSCTAVAIMDAFWATERPLYYVTTAALQQKTENELVSCAGDLFKRFRSIQDVAGLFKKRSVTVTTYAILAHNIQKKSIPQNAVIILDEVHNLYFPLPTQRMEHDQLIKCLVYDNPPLPNAKIFIMTATPGTNPEQLVKLLNIIRDRTKPPITEPNFRDIESIDRFTRSIVGMISYLDTNLDASLFPKIIEKSVQYAPLKEHQMQKYLEKLRETEDIYTSYDALLQEDKVSSYWLKARKASNSMHSFTAEMQVDEFSAKVPLLLTNITNHPNEKHFVYSAFYERNGFGGHGVQMISKFMERLGFEELTAEKAVPDLQPKKRFIVLTSNRLTPRSKSEKIEKESVKNLLSLFNSRKNTRGELVSVALASQGYNEGIDLKAIRHVHLFEPLVEYNMEKQAIGRAVRYCSHSQLRKEFGEWTVKVHRYVSEASRDAVMRLVPYNKSMTPEQVSEANDANNEQEIMVEKIVYKEARERIKEMKLVELCMKRAAIDCMLTNSFHELNGKCTQEDIKL